MVKVPTDLQAVVDTIVDSDRLQDAIQSRSSNGIFAVTVSEHRVG